MNIFFLDDDVRTNAQYHCDKHVVKMVVEYTQIISTTLSNSKLRSKLPETSQVIYKPTHSNHPCVLWCKESLENLKYLLSLGIHLSDEYTERYRKVHRSSLVLHSLEKEFSLLNPELFPKLYKTALPLCMPDQYKVPDDPVKSYRNYYIGDKASFAQWKYTSKPMWWPF